MPVVSYRNSTSNHNESAVRTANNLLYLIEILHQTTTSGVEGNRKAELYLIEILHQTTTLNLITTRYFCCILSKFYIKPQHSYWFILRCFVVSYRNSTSNHNRPNIKRKVSTLYLIEILHQTTTRACVLARKQPLYLIEILHQTTTLIRLIAALLSCILSKFYIKPQQCSCFVLFAVRCILSKFYIKPQQIRSRSTTINSCILSKFYIKPQRRIGR